MAIQRATEVRRYKGSIGGRQDAMTSVTSPTNTNRIGRHLRPQSLIKIAASIVHPAGLLTGFTPSPLTSLTASRLGQHDIQHCRRARTYIKPCNLRSRALRRVYVHIVRQKCMLCASSLQHHLKLFASRRRSHRRAVLKTKLHTGGPRAALYAMLYAGLAASESAPTKTDDSADQQGGFVYM